MSLPTKSNFFSSKFLAFVISAFILIAHFYLRKYNYLDFKNVLGWDVLAYYIYLPFTFIYGDPGISDQTVVQYIFDNYNPSGTFYQAYPLPNGNWSPMYTMGMAVFYFPFFVIGHIWALLSNYPADGFSYPYQFSISNGMMLYIVAGIFFFRKLLLNFFSDRLTSLVLLSILLGTSFFHEAIIDECGPHAVMFAGFSVILYLNVLWHKNPTPKISFLLGLTLGLCILARGSGIFIAFIPLLWNIYDKESLKRKVDFVILHRKQILIGAAGLAVFPLIQITYWKIITEEFIFNTYQVTPGFDWFDPHFTKVFFSYKKGWLLYTPIIAFALFGLFFLWKNNKKIALPIIIFALVNIYVISSWGTWWQGGSFGSRYFVESYAILAIPMGYFFKSCFRKKVLRWIIAALVAFFVFLNLFQTWQFNNFIFDGYTMTKEYYWRVFFETDVGPEDRKYQEIVRNFGPVDVFENPEDYNKRTYGYLNFEDINSIYFMDEYRDSTFSYSPPFSYKIVPEIIYGPTFKIPYNQLTEKEHAWIRVSFQFLANHDIVKNSAELVIEMNHNEGQYIEKRRSWNLGTFPFQQNEWNEVSVDYLTPYPLSEENDIFKIYVYVTGQKPVYIDNFKVDVFERKW